MGIINGTGGNDTLTGATTTTNQLNGFGGNDSLTGGTARDVISGGAGNDTLVGRAGHDVLNGGDGTDLLNGNGGDDDMFGNAGMDTLSGELGNDFLDGGLGTDTYLLALGHGNDVISEDARVITLVRTISGGLNSGDEIFDTVPVDYATIVDSHTLTGLEAGTTYVVSATVDGNPNGTLKILDQNGNILDTAVEWSYDENFVDNVPAVATFVASEGGTYQIRVGASFNASGRYQINVETAHANTGDNIVEYGEGIALSDLSFSHDGHHLVIGINGTTDTLKLRGQMDAATVTTVRLADGTTLTANQLLALANQPSDANQNLIGLDDNDTIDALGGADSVNGRSGDDNLSGGTGNDSLLGGSGNDTLTGGTGDDHLDGGDGADTHVFLPGDGNDTLVSSAWTTHTTFTGIFFDGNESLTPWDAMCDTHDLGALTPGTRYRVEAGPGDVLGPVMYVADARGNSIFGDSPYGGQPWKTAMEFIAVAGETYSVRVAAERTGDYQLVLLEPDMQTDTLHMGGGVQLDDLQLVHRQADLIVTLVSSGDSVTVSGQFSGAGIDQLLLDDGSIITATALAALAVIEATALSDTFTGGDGNDVFDALAGDDELRGGGGNDTLVGGDGRDQLWGGAGDDSLVGGNLSDSIHGEDGNDVLLGGADSDFIHGDAGNDTLSGGGSGAAGDGLLGDTGSDTYLLDPGFGKVTLIESSTDPTDFDVIVFGAGIASADLRFSVEDSSTMVISIAGSSDKVSVWNQFPFNAAIDEIRFADGTLLSFSDMRALAIFPSVADDTLVGGSGDDNINALGGNDWVEGEEGNDTVIGAAGDDILLGGTGNDRLYGSSGHDFAFGDHGNDAIGGGNGNDTLVGGGGNDWIFGRAGNDFMNGSVGRDMLLGGTGNDTFVGGVGSDTFVFAAGMQTSIDLLQDFSHADGDRIQIDGSEIGIGLTGALNEIRLALGTAATTEKQRFVFDSESGNLYYDADGSGSTAAVHFATLAVDAALVAGDIVLV